MSSHPSPSLIAITMLARSGATALAWARFEAGGFSPDDPAALAVKGRLLKDRARATTGAAARGLFAEAAAAYGTAAAIDGTTYPLINAATLTLLGGDGAGAARLAETVLERLDSGGPDQETPYYRAATRAEALLLLGRREDAEAALAAAIALAPDAPEDHATTLRQFALILAETGADAAWLDRYRPGRVLHFAGRIAPPLTSAAEAALAGEIAGILAADRVGMAFGALAAGADLVIAEAVIAHGAALHIVLPAPVAVFVAASVLPFGDGWKPRFDAVLAAAARIDEGTASRVDATSIALAGERAMGRAVLAADRLATAAVQLVIPAKDEAPGTHTVRQAAIWRGTGRPQHALEWPAAVPNTRASDEDTHLVALVEISFDPGASARLLETVQQALARLAPALGAAVTPTGVRFAWHDPASAADAANAVLAAIDPAYAPRLAAHYTIMAEATDPFTGQRALFGAEVARTARLAALVPPGAIYGSEDFLAGLVLRSAAYTHEYVGEAPGERGTGDLPLHAISKR